MSTFAVAPNRSDSPPTEARAPGRSTPSWLRLTSSVLAGLVVAAALVSLFAVLGRQTNTSAARSNVEPLLIDAQTMITALSDADTTAAGSFLAGRVAPAAARTRYAHDLALASARVSEAARLAGTPVDTRDLGVLSVGLPVYAGLVQTAVADQRQGLPVAAAYLGEASTFLRGSLISAASSLYQTAQGRLDRDRAAASRLTVVAIALVVWVVLVAGLIWLQVGLCRRFRRIFNLPALAATGAVAVLLVWSGAALGAQGAHVHRATRHGLDPLSVYTRAQILALQARADDELTLVTRDSVPSYQVDFASVGAQLNQLLDNPRAPSDQRAVLTAALRAWTDYQQVHSEIRVADSNGSLGRAIALASGSGPAALPAASTDLQSALGRGVTQAQHSFGEELAAATNDLRGLAVGEIVLSLLAAALILVSAQQRIAEYR